MNTFEGLTLSYSCRKKDEKLVILDETETEKLKESFYPPIYNLDFSEGKIMEDTLSILWHFITYSQFTHHDKTHEKVNIYNKGMMIMILMKGKN